MHLPAAPERFLPVQRCSSKEGLRGSTWGPRSPSHLYFTVKRRTHGRSPRSTYGYHLAMASSSWRATGEGDATGALQRRRQSAVAARLPRETQRRPTAFIFWRQRCLHPLAQDPRVPGRRAVRGSHALPVMPGGLRGVPALQVQLPGSIWRMGAEPCRIRLRLTVKCKGGGHG